MVATHTDRRAAPEEVLDLALRMVRGQAEAVVPWRKTRR